MNETSNEDSSSIEISFFDLLLKINEEEKKKVEFMLSNDVIIMLIKYNILSYLHTRKSLEVSSLKHDQ
jgi:hypothetical protein